MLPRKALVVVAIAATLAIGGAGLARSVDSPPRIPSDYIVTIPAASPAK